MSIAAEKVAKFRGGIHGDFRPLGDLVAVAPVGLLNDVDQVEPTVGHVPGLAGQHIPRELGHPLHGQGDDGPGEVGRGHDVVVEDEDVLQLAQLQQDVRCVSQGEL